MDAEARIAALEERNEALEAELAALREAFGRDPNNLYLLGLTGAEQTIVGVLHKRGSASREQLMAALYGLRADDVPAVKIVDVLVCKARKKLSRFGISIALVRAQGYCMSRECRKRLSTLVQEVADA